MASAASCAQLREPLALATVGSCVHERSALASQVGVLGARVVARRAREQDPAEEQRREQRDARVGERELAAGVSGCASIALAYVASR